MGLFWDLMQQSQISEQRNRAEDLEDRVRFLEVELRQTQSVLNKLITLLEEKFGQDIDGDGKIG
jgi:chaperonin cofactor prefoldin